MRTDSIGSHQSSIARADGISQDASSGMKPGDRILIDGEFRYSENNKDPAIGRGMYAGTATVMVSSFGGDPPSKITFRIESLKTRHPVDGREIRIDYARDFGLVSMKITKELNMRKPDVLPSAPNSGAGIDGDAVFRDSPRRDSISSDTASSSSSVSGITQSSDAASSSSINKAINPNQLHPMNRGPFDFLWGKGGRGGKTRKNRRRNCKNVKSRRARPGKMPRVAPGKGRARKSRK